MDQQTLIRKKEIKALNLYHQFLMNVFGITVVRIS